MNKIIVFAVGLILLLPQFSYGRCQNSHYPPAYDSVRVIEKVYLHIDRESYYPGDDIWFKAYLIDATDRKLSNNSMNLHVELISTDQKIIDSNIVRLDNGLGNGDFRLSEKIQSGRYMLRAYTNYMRNFGDQLFFTKDITIINSSDALKAFADSINDKRNIPEISFYPEGGSLVDNVTSRVAFKAVDVYGYAKNISGKIYSSEGELAGEFKSGHKGMGSFSLTPVSGLKYFAFIQTLGGDSLKYELPKSFSSGVVLAISDNRKKELVISLRTNSQTLPSILDHDLSLVVSARNTPLKTYSFRMKSMNSFFNLPTEDIPDGIAMLTLLGTDNKPLCERLVYIQNNEEVKVVVEAEKSEFKKRDSVSLKISLMVNSTTSQDAFLSLSATDNIFTDNSRFHSNISSWFLLESDVHGPVEEPSYYFDASNPERLSDLDLLLLTQGWRDFEWKYNTMIYPPEIGFTISGRVRKKFADVPIKNSIVNIGIFNRRKPLITYILTDSSGRFCLKGVELTGRAKLIASVTGDKNVLKGWLLLDSIKYSPATIGNNIVLKEVRHENDPLSEDFQSTSGIPLSKNNVQKFIQYAEFKSSFQKKYRISDTITPGEVTISAKRLDESGPSLARSRHYLMATPDASLLVTPQLEKYGTTRQLFTSGIFFSSHGIERPIFVIDGMKVSGDLFFSFPIASVERFDVLDTWATAGAFGPNQEDPRNQTKPATGVYSIITRSTFTTNSPIFHSVKVKISGYNEPRIFYSPKHHTTLESDYKPDLRTTLLWEPNIKVDNDKEVLLNYFNSDNPSKVKVIVEGITTGGIPVTGYTEYEVK